MTEGLEEEKVLKRNVPVAERRPIDPAGPERRPIGLAKGLIEVSNEFSDPLPEEMLDAFEGKLP